MQVMYDIKFRPHNMIARFESAIEEIAEKAVDASAEVIGDKAREMVPVDTGELLSSIEVRDNAVVVKADYALYVEYGTATVAAQPFLAPSLFLTKRQQLDAFARDMRGRLGRLGV